MEKAHRLVKLPDRPMFGYWCSYGSSQTHNCKGVKSTKQYLKRGGGTGFSGSKQLRSTGKLGFFRKTITAFVFDVFAKTWPKKHVVTL